LRAELGELRALNAEVALRCELYAEQVTALRALERDSADLERRSADLELVSVAREAAQRAHSLFDGHHRRARCDHSGDSLCARPAAVLETRSHFRQPQV